MKCSRCGQLASEDEMIQFDGRWICAACKPMFVQELREGGQAPVADPLPAGFEERMLGFWPLVSLSWRVMRHDALPIGALVLLVAVPINLLLLAVEPEEAATLSDIGRQFRFTQFLEVMIGVLTSLGIAKIVEQRLLGRPMSFGAGLRHALVCWFPGVITGLLETLIVLLLSLALIVPGIIWSVYYTFSRVVVSLRTLSGKAALDYSKSLVKGCWWGVVGRVLGLSFLALLPSFLIEGLAGFVISHAALSFATSLVTDICLGFVTIGISVLFLNLDAMCRSRQISVADPSPL